MYIGSSFAPSIRASQYKAAPPWLPRIHFCNAEMRSYRASPVRSYEVATERFIESSSADSGVSVGARRICSSRESAVRASPAASDAIEVMILSVICGYWGNRGCRGIEVVVEDSGSAFASDDSIGEDGGGGEGDEMSSGKAAGELNRVTSTCFSSCSEDVTRATAFLMIRMISSSLSRSSTNTLQLCQEEGWDDVHNPYLHRLSNAPFSLKDGFSVVVPMSLIHRFRNTYLSVGKCVVT